MAKRIKIIDIENGEISYNHSDDQAQVRAIHIGKDGGSLTVCNILITFQDFNCVAHYNS